MGDLVLALRSKACPGREVHFPALSLSFLTIICSTSFSIFLIGFREQTDRFTSLLFSEQNRALTTIIARRPHRKTSKSISTAFQQFSDTASEQDGNVKTGSPLESDDIPDLLPLE